MCDLFGKEQTVPQTTAQFNQFGQAQNTTQNTAQQQNQNTTATTTTPSNPWSSFLGQQLAGLGYGIAQGGFGPYPGQGIAPLNAGQQESLSSLYNQGQGVGSLLIPAGEGFLGAGSNLMQQAGQGITGEDVAGFYNPMASNITANLQDVFGQQNLANRIGSTAAAGGTGSDRAAVAQGLLAQKQGLAAGQVYTDLYQKALQAAQQQKVQQLGAGAGVAGLGLPTISAGFGGYGQALQAAGVSQAQQQAQLSAEYQRALGQYQDPMVRAQSAAGLMPAVLSGPGATGTTAGTAQQLGAGQTLASGTQTGQGTATGFGQITYPAPSIFGQLAGLGTAAVGAASLFSDKRAKTDVQKAGKDPGTGLPLYAYRYKGDPKTYPKVVGPMAQDVQKKYPGAVREMGGQPKGYQYGGEVEEDSGDYGGGDDYSTGYTSQDYYSGEDIGASDTSANELYKGFTERQEQAKTAQKPWERAQKTLKAINMMRQGAGALDTNTNLKGPTFTTPPYMSKLGQPILPGMQEGGAVEPETELEQAGPTDEQTMRKRLQAVKLMQQGARGLETNTDLKGPAFPRPSYMSQLGRPFLPGTYQAGGAVAPRGMPMPRAASPNQGIYPQALNRASLLSAQQRLPAYAAPQARIAMLPGLQSQRGFPVVRQEGGRVDERTRNEWVLPRSRPEGAPRQDWGRGVAEGEYQADPGERRRGYPRVIVPRGVDPSQYGGRLDQLESGRFYPRITPYVATDPTLRQELRESYRPNVRTYQEGGMVEAGDASGGTTAALSQVLLPQARPADADTGFMGPLTSPMPHAVTGAGGVDMLPVEGEPPPMEALTEPMPHAMTGQGGIGLPEPAPLPVPRPEGLGAVPTGVGGGAARGGGGGGLGTSPAMALLQAGLGMMAASGQRDARGLPMAPLAAIGQGGMAGVKTYQEQQQLAQKNKLAQQSEAFRQLQLNETIRHHRMLEGMPRKIGTDFNTGLDIYINPADGTRYTIDSAGQKQPVVGGVGQTGAMTATDVGQLENQPDATPQSVNEQVKQRQFDYSSGGPGTIEKGMEVPKPAPFQGPGMMRSSAQLEVDAARYLETGAEPKTSMGKSPVAIAQQRYNAAVKNYAASLLESQGISPQEIAEKWRKNPYAMRWMLGWQGRTATAMGTAMRHLDSLEEAYAELKNGNIKPLNALKQRFGIQLGLPEAQTFQVMNRIVGAEIVKGVVGAQSSVVEREDAAKGFGIDLSPAQFANTKRRVQDLLAGQLGGPDGGGRLGEALNAGVKEEDFIRQVGASNFKILRGLAPAGGKTTPAPTTSVPAAGAKEVTREEYEKLPSGATYLKDGREYRKQ